jgi:Flp pilus assembly pilin Flp
MTAAVERFIRDCAGTTALEYAIIGSVISIAIIVAAASIGLHLNGMLGAITGKFD